MRVVAKELQKISNSTIRRRRRVCSVKIQKDRNTKCNTHVQAGRSYAQAARSNNGQAQDILDEGTISQMLLKIMAEPDNPTKGDKTRK
jgi:hypothetical protein